MSPDGFEPSTLGLKGRCSTTELWALRRAAIWMICGENARWRGSGPTIRRDFGHVRMKSHEDLIS